MGLYTWLHGFGPIHWTQDRSPNQTHILKSQPCYQLTAHPWVLSNSSQRPGSLVEIQLSFPQLTLRLLWELAHRRRHQLFLW